MPDHISPQFDPAALSEAQADGFECIAGCGYDQLRAPDPDRSMRPIGHGPHGQMFICSTCDAERAAQRRALAEIDQAHAEMAAQDSPADLAARAERESREVYRRAIAALEEKSDSDPFEVAEETGIGIYHLTAWLNGREELTVRELILLAEYLRVEVRDWFGPADEQEVTR